MEAANLAFFNETPAVCFSTVRLLEVTRKQSEIKGSSLEIRLGVSQPPKSLLSFLQELKITRSESSLIVCVLFFCVTVKRILYQQIMKHQSERMSLFISPHVNHHHDPSSSSSATDSLVARVHTQLYLSIESNRKICRLQLGRLSIRKTTETMKPKASRHPFRTRGRD